MWEVKMTERVITAFYTEITAIERKTQTEIKLRSDTRIESRKEIEYENWILLIKFFGGNDTNKTTKHSIKNIGKRKFAVTSYYNGEKNIDEIITRIAVSKAYEDIENGLIYKNIFNSVFDLAKREVIW